MNYIDQLKELANQLDRQGMYKQANLIDKYLFRFAQNAPALPAETAPAAPAVPAEAPEAAQPLTPLPTAAPELELSPEDKKKVNEKLTRATFMMMSELRDFFAKNLNDFKYFGEDNIKTIQAAIDQMMAIFRVVLRNMTSDYDREALSVYEAHLKSLQKEVDRSKKMRLTPTKVKIDKFLLYNEFETMMKKIERHYDAGVKELQPVLKKARAIKDAFGNVIQQTSEEIAHADLIETK